jgi:hypothetical protein
MRGVLFVLTDRLGGQQGQGIALLQRNETSCRVWGKSGS